MCWGLLLIKLQAWTPILKNICKRLLLKLKFSKRSWDLSRLKGPQYLRKIKDICCFVSLFKECARKVKQAWYSKYCWISLIVVKKVSPGNLVEIFGTSFIQAISDIVPNFFFLFPLFLSLIITGDICHCTKKWCFILRISSVNVAKFTGNCGFGHI